jgi:hypothetical protein
MACDASYGAAPRNAGGQGLPEHLSDLADVDASIDAVKEDLREQQAIVQRIDCSTLRGALLKLLSHGLRVLSRLEHTREVLIERLAEFLARNVSSAPHARRRRDC